MAAATIRYGFNALEQTYMFKCDGQMISLSVTNNASVAFMAYLAKWQDKIKNENPRVSVRRSAMIADIETPYTITATDAAEEWEKLYEAYRVEQSKAGRTCDPVQSV